MFRWSVGIACLATMVSCGPAPCTDNHGNITISTDADWQRFVDQGCTELSGELAFRGALLSLSEASSTPALTTVGSLVVSGNVPLTFLSLPLLTTVNSNLEIEGNTALTRVNLPALKTVGGSLLFHDNAAATALSLPALKIVTGDLSLWSHTGLDGRSSVFTELNLPALIQVGGDLDVDGNTALKTLNLPTLYRVFKSMIISNPMERDGRTPALTSVSMPVLSDVGRDLRITSNPSLAGLSFPLLTRVSGAMSILKNASLQQCIADGIKARVTNGPASYVSSENDGTPNVCP